MNCKFFLSKGTAFLPYAFFALAIGLVPILYQPYADFVKYTIYSLALLYLCCYFPKENSSCRKLIDFIKPWSVWYLGILMQIAIHGVSGNSALLNAFALMCILFLALQNTNICREQVLWGISLNVIIFSSLILLYVYFEGLSSNVIGLNKNRIIPEITILGCVCYIAYIFERESYSKKLRYTLLVSCALLFCTVVITEVRTALLGIFSIGPLLLLYKNASTRNVFLKFCFIALLAIILFWITGRLQQGLVDLAKYEAGNSNTSWGLRIEFWKLATDGFLEKPLFGWGYKPFEKLIASGFVFPLPNTTKIPHFHSDYFSQLVSYGLLGIASWLTSMFLLYQSSKQDPVRIIILFSTLAMGLSERIWHYNSTSILLIMFCWVLLYITDKNLNGVSKS